MAPEIVNRYKYGLPADIWSLGVLLYKIITGKFPFRAKNESELFNKISIGKMESCFFSANL